MRSRQRLKIVFKTLKWLYTPVPQGFNSSSFLIVVEVVLSRNYYCEAEGWPSFKYVATHSLTFISEVLRLSGSPFVASTVSL